MKRRLSSFLIAVFLINTILAPSAHAFSPPILSPAAAAFPAGRAITHTTRIKLTYPDNTYINYTYDQINRLTAIKNSTNATVGNFTYDALSRRTKEMLNNGMEAVYVYDDVSNLKNITNRYQQFYLHLQ